MSCIELLLCIIFPPLAVIDKGCGSILLVTLLSILGWVPGVIAALIILSTGEKNITIIQKGDSLNEKVQKDENIVSSLDNRVLAIIVIVIGVIILCCSCCFISLVLNSLSKEDYEVAPISYPQKT